MYMHGKWKAEIVKDEENSSMNSTRSFIYLDLESQKTKNVDIVDYRIMYKRKSYIHRIIVYHKQHEWCGGNKMNQKEEKIIIIWMSILYRCPCQPFINIFSLFFLSFSFSFLVSATAFISFIHFSHFSHLFQLNFVYSRDQTIYTSCSLLYAGKQNKFLCQKHEKGWNFNLH